jgi:hypothetical protein
LSVGQHFYLTILFGIDVEVQGNGLLSLLWNSFAAYINGCSDAKYFLEFTCTNKTDARTGKYFSSALWRLARHLLGGCFAE